ncbi:MAG: hypothetical protein AAFY38_10440 [Pseudomonadota bacterium]
MNTPTNHTGTHLSEPVRTPENPLEYEWLTVDEAVAFCADRGLSRTPKTLRKWAERSYNKEDADIIVRREDTMWSYRWKIEKASLARKVDQELSLSGANTSELVRTVSVQDDKQDLANTSEPVRTGATTSQATSVSETEEQQSEPSADMSEPVRTGAHEARKLEVSSNVLEEVRERLRDRDEEIAFLRDQLSKAQAEVERRATSTDEALKTIDRVVRSFELQAEANKALALGGVVIRDQDAEPVRYAETQAPTQTEEPAPQKSTETHSYQQPRRTWGGV